MSMTVHPDSPIRRVTLEVESHVEQAGWDQPPRLFALVDTRRLMADHPELSEELSAGNEFTPVEQDDLPPGELEQTLLQIGWPESVDGVAVAIERTMLPPSVEADLPDDPTEAAEFAANHPERSEVRIVAAVLRDDSTHSTVRARVPESSDEPGAEGDPERAPLLEGPDLVPGLVELLRGTLA